MNKTLPLGVIFDMDGVLLDSEPFICKAAMMMFAERGQSERRTLPGADNQFHQRTTFRGRRGLVRGKPGQCAERNTKLVKNENDTDLSS